MARALPTAVPLIFLRILLFDALKLANGHKGQILSFKRVGVKPPVEADLFAGPLEGDQ
jgi:hypothetical protein